MPLFKYQARTQKGEMQVGTVEASSKEAAIETLHRHNLMVTFLEEEKLKTFFEREIRFFIRGISRKDIVVFTRQLSALFGAKVPLVEALQTLEEQVINKELKRVAADLANDVNAGESLSEAMARHPHVFSELYINVVRSGEVSGKLQESLAYIAQFLDREYSLLQKIKGALLYPAVVLVAFLVIFTLLILFVIPQFQEVLIETGAELPLVTKIILFAAGLARISLLWILAILITGGFFFWRYLHTKEGKIWWDKVILQLPIIGPILINFFVARFADNLSTLITAGLPITQALKVTSEVVGNVVYKQVIDESQEEVTRGGQIHTILKLHPEIVPPMVTQMVAVGERTGKTEELLAHAANFFQREVDQTIDNLITLIEPALIITLGIFVGILVAAIILPIYNLAGTL